MPANFFPGCSRPPVQRDAVAPWEYRRPHMSLFTLIRWIDRLNSGISACAMWLIIPLAGIMLYDVILRYFFDASTVWGMELSMMVFGIYMLYAGPSSILQKVQVGVDIFAARWRARTRAAVNCVTYIFTCVFFASLFHTSLVYAIESFRLSEHSSSAWGQPVYHWKALIPVAVVLIFLQSFAEFLRNLHLACTGKEFADDLPCGPDTSGNRKAGGKLP